MITNNDKEEIKISKYGKKKDLSNKSNQKFRNTFFIFIASLFTFFILLFILKIKNPNVVIIKESNPKNENKINDEISEKDKLNEIALKTKLIPYPMIQYFLQRKEYALVNIFKFAKIKKKI